VQQVIDARLACNSCAHEWEIEIPAFRCPQCAGGDVEIASGDEFEVEAIEVGAPAAAWRDSPHGDIGEGAEFKGPM
jgi:hypothetical protein